MSASASTPAHVKENITYAYTVDIKNSAENSMKHKKSMTMEPLMIEDDNSVIKQDLKIQNPTSRKFLNESITFPSRNTFIYHNLLNVYNVYKDLKFNNTEIIRIGFEIIHRCAQYNIRDIKISKTAQDEILIYRKKNGEFYNLLLDIEGDVSFMFIGKKLGSEKVEFFSKEKGLDYDKIVSLL